MYLFYWDFLAIFVIFFIKPGSGRVCLRDEFECGDGTCLELHLRCDGHVNCDNDEQNCNGNCADNEYACESGACIPSYMQCNRRRECHDTDDEAGCIKSEGCRYHQYMCLPSRTCVFYAYQCNNQCPDGDTNPVCDGNCGPDEYTCINSGGCIPDYYRCDGRADCTGGDDEDDCDQIQLGPDGCNTHTYTCTQFGHCNPIHQACSEPFCHDDISADCFADCGPDEFKCRSGYCIPEDYVCDGFHDCLDFDDDEGDRCIPERVCPLNRIQCEDSSCLQIYDQCNGLFDVCVDDCDGNCGADEFHCESGACIPAHMECNRRRDCWDESDELDCTNSEGCRYHWTQCKPSMICIQNHLMCEPDQCYSWDEQPICDGNCGPDEFACQSGACVPAYHRCDGGWDCFNGEDEVDCDEIQTDVDNCPLHQYSCSGTCNIFSTACTVESCYSNFTAECLGECGPGFYKCRSGYCLPEKYVCDGFHDCFDFDDDEANCVRICPFHQFQCGELCVSYRELCDGESTCLNDEDESNCDGNCAPDEFQCQSGACISLDKICDREWDCIDGDDETDCINTLGCRYHEYQCFPSMVCIPNRSKCSFGCRAEDTQPLCDGSCGADEFECDGDGACIPRIFQCDLDADCSRGEDESCTPSEIKRGFDNCPPHQFNCSGECFPIQHACSNSFCYNDFASECLGECDPGFYKCKSGYCLPQEYVCDGIHDCWHFDDDEGNCTTPVQVIDRVCPFSKFQCGDETCLAYFTICDGTPQCDNDEQNCDIAENCTAEEFQCESGACIPAHMECNRRQDCDDEDDEQHCTNSEKCRYHAFQCFPSMSCEPMLTMCDSPCPAGDEQPTCDGNCGPDEFMCDSGACIPQHYRCDGGVDCKNFDDEADCDEIQSDIDGCPPHLFSCQNECTPLYEACHQAFCHTSLAEDCFRECGPGFYQCRSGYCLPEHYVCDGFHDCSDVDDDEANCPQTDSVITTNCSLTGVSARLLGSYVRSLLPGAGEQLEMIGDDSTPLDNCFAVKCNETDEYKMKFPPGIGQCAANINESDTEIVVTYKVSLGVAAGSSPHIITRTAKLSVVVFQCAYNRTGIATMDQPLVSMISEVKMDLGKTATSIKLEMARYQSDSFATIETEQTITIGSPVYIGVRIIVAAENNLVLQGIDCLVKDNENDTETVYPVVIEGCAVPDPLDMDGNVIYNVTDSHKFLFSFLGFTWSNVEHSEQKIWVTCQMKVCDKTDDNECKIDCAPMGPVAHSVKRSITDETDDSTKKISIGPFVLAPELGSDDQLVCNKEELGCSHMCGIDTTGAARCICPEGYFLIKDGKTCVEVNQNIETLMEVSLVTSLCLVILIILVLTVVMVVKRKDAKKVEI